MERQPHGTNGDSKSRRIAYRNTEELEAGNKGNRRSLKEYEKAIQQEKTESSRIKKIWAF